MKELLQQADRIPVTLLVAIAYITLFALTNMHGPERSFDELLEQYGLLRPAWVADGDIWRLIAAAFLHGGLIHIGFNLWMLIAVGPALELSLGSLRFAALYLVSAVGGHLAVCLCYPWFDDGLRGVLSGVLGGSGALFGMLGSLVALNMRQGRHLFSFLEHEGSRRLLALIVINLVLGWFIPLVSNTGHIGGLIAGFLLTFLWLAPGREPTRSLFRWRFAATALFFGLLFHSVEPATRFDRLWLSSFEANGAERDAMRRAAWMSYSGEPDASDADGYRLTGRERDLRAR